MPLLRSSTRPTAVQCFFCLSPSLLPARPTTATGTSRPFDDRKGKYKIAEPGTKWNWQCERCGCHNIRDERGDMISDLPAMHDTAYNERSFSLRAKPSASHLPSSSSASPSLFCHSCLANQTLIMNMLANYLPDDDDPSFPTLYAGLPSYLSKLHSRYPPVCRDCQPAVDVALRKSDQRAQVQAWGSALNRGVQAQAQAQASSSRSTVGGTSRGDVLVWRIRGALWWTSMGLSLAQGVLVTTRTGVLSTVASQQLPGSVSVSASLLAFHLCSIGWIAWDPYWLRRIRSRDTTKVRGRGVWVRNMLLILALRISSSLATWYLCSETDTTEISTSYLAGAQLAFGLEVALLVHSLLSIRVSQPVAIQLVRPVSLTSSPAPSHPNANANSIPAHPSSPTGFSSLSIAQSQPVRAERANPIFGQMSLHQQAQARQAHESVAEESMDWEPSPAAAVYNGGYTHRPPFARSPSTDDGGNEGWQDDWDTFAINKQRMFPRPQGGGETGLENLLAGWGIGGGPTPITGEGGTRLDPPSAAADHSRSSSDTIRTSGYILVALRACGAILSTTAVSRYHAIDTVAIENGIGLSNHVLLLLEILTACIRLSLNLQTRSKGHGVGLAFSTLDLVLRGVALSPLSPRCERTALEWAGWTTLNIVGLAVVG